MLTTDESNTLKLLHEYALAANVEFERAKLSKDKATAAFENYIHTLSSLPDKPNGSWIYGSNQTVGIGILGNAQVNTKAPGITYTVETVYK